MDVKALYPSLNKADVVRCVEELIGMSSVSLEIDNVKEICKYLAIVLSRETIESEGLGRYLPKCYNEGFTNRRNKPGIAYWIQIKPR